MQPPKIVSDMRDFAIKCNLEVFGSISGMTAKEIESIAKEATTLRDKVEKERPQFALQPQLPFQQKFNELAEILANYQKALMEAYVNRKRFEEEHQHRNRLVR
jgi:hypothetical protein